jgi:hypothetical protein
VVLVVALLAVVVVQEESAAQTQLVMDAVALMVAVLVAMYQTILAVAEQCVLFGPAQLVNSHQRILVMFN